MCASSPAAAWGRLFEGRVSAGWSRVGVTTEVRREVWSAMSGDLSGSRSSSFPLAHGAGVVPTSRFPRDRSRERRPVGRCGGCRARLGELAVVGVIRESLDEPRGVHCCWPHARSRLASLDQRRSDGDLLLCRRTRDQTRTHRRAPVDPARCGPAGRCRSRRHGRARCRVPGDCGWNRSSRVGDSNGHGHRARCWRSGRRRESNPLVVAGVPAWSCHRGRHRRNRDYRCCLFDRSVLRLAGRRHRWSCRDVACSPSRSSLDLGVRGHRRGRVARASRGRYSSDHCRGRHGTTGTINSSTWN